MGVECSACRKWEEGIYWNNFHSVQFFQSLSGRFHQQLAIPKKFANNMGEKLSETVALKGPTGASWTVGLTSSGDALFFKKGWKKFVEDNSLEENDVLLFKYGRDSCFDVQMFDGQSFCEKEASYFVRKCDHLELDNGGGTKKNYIRKSLEIIGDSSTDDSQSGSSKELRTGEAWMPPPAGHHLRPKRLIQKAASSSTQEISCRISGYPVIYESNRRPVTDEEKEKALQLANAAVTEGSCIVVMRPSHVYKGFFMSIPAAWAAIHLPGKAHDVVLRVPDNTHTWTTKYYKRGRGCGFSGGWKDFAIENFLEESDVCLFKIASETNIDSVVMDVTIFRVVKEVVAATRLNPSGSRARKL